MPHRMRQRYKGFHIVRTHGRFYGVPRHLHVTELLQRKRLDLHPDVLSAESRPQLEARIDGWHDNPVRPEPLGTHNGFELFRLRGLVHAIPQAIGQVDLGLEEERRRARVLTGATAEEVKERITRLGDAVPVEFAGWLPIFEFSGNCGSHPQFTHTAEAPPGYRFTCSLRPTPRPARWRQWLAQLTRRGWHAVGKARALTRPLLAIFRRGPKVAWRDRLRVLAAIVRLCHTLLQRGARPGAILRFLQSRHFESQLLLAHHRGPVFLTSMPYTYGQNPWIVEIEDPTTLFYPLVENGNTKELNLRDSPYFPIVKTLLESDQCKGVLTHMQSTARLVPALFASDTIAAKVHYVPLGVKLPQRRQRHIDRDGDPLHLVFINSWCQVPANFFVRGGLDVLEAFATLKERYPQLRLTLRTELPPLDRYFHRIIESGWVRVIDRFLTDDEMSRLLADSHIFLLPSARVHIVSLLQAMGHGLAVVTSDGWGIQEYVTHERNGLIVPGRHGKTSWADSQAGMLREDYEPTFTTDPQVVEGIVTAVSRLVEDRKLRKRLGRTARLDVQTTYNLERWNEGLRQALDGALKNAADLRALTMSSEAMKARRNSKSGDLGNGTTSRRGELHAPSVSVR